MANEKNNAVMKVEKNITDTVLNKVVGFAQTGELVLPPDYSAENALKAAWLALQTVEDRNGSKALNVCSKESIANSLLDMVVQGLTPAKKQCYFIVYGKELTLSRSYMGTVAVAKRFSNVVDVRAQIVYEDDEFEYEINPVNGRIFITKHTQKIENIDINKIKAAYAVVQVEDSDPYIEIMTIAQIKKAWGQGATKGNSPAHKNFAEEMAKKSVINRACKLFVNTSSDSAILTESFNRITENDYRKNDEVVIDVEEDEIQELKNEAEKAVFGTGSEEGEENIDNAEKDTEKEIKDVTDTFESDMPEQLSMEG